MRVRYIKNKLNGSNKNKSSHFVEIQAFGNNSTNLALNKNVTCNVQTTGIGEPINCIVDGVYNNSNLYYNIDLPNPEVVVDLGEIYDVNMIKVWHVYSDGRKYKDNIVSVSEDGIYYEEQFNSNVDGEYAETSSGKEIVVNKPYKPNLSVNVENGNFVINISPYGNSINSIDMYLRNNRVATFDYNGANITHKIDVNTLAFGHNEYSFDVFYNTSEQINFKYVYDYNVVSVGSSTSLDEAVIYTSNMANTDERNKLMFADKLRENDIEIPENSGIFDMIGKLGKMNKLATGSEFMVSSSHQFDKYPSGTVYSNYIDINNLEFEPIAIIAIDTSSSVTDYNSVTTLFRLKIDDLYVANYCIGTQYVKSAKLDTGSICTFANSDKIFMPNGVIRIPLVYSSFNKNGVVHWIAIG